MTLARDHGAGARSLSADPGSDLALQILSTANLFPLGPGGALSHAPLRADLAWVLICPHARNRLRASPVSLRSRRVPGLSAPNRARSGSRARAARSPLLARSSGGGAAGARPRARARLHTEFA